MQLLHNSKLSQPCYYKTYRRYQIKLKKLNFLIPLFYLLFFYHFFSLEHVFVGKKGYKQKSLVRSNKVDIQISNLQYDSVTFKQLFPFLLSTRGEYSNNEVWSTSCKRGVEVCSVGWRYSKLRPGSWILSTPDQRRLPVRD